MRVLLEVTQQAPKPKHVAKIQYAPFLAPALPTRVEFILSKISSSKYKEPIIASFAAERIDANEAQ
jgi:hypothetical protein